MKLSINSPRAQSGLEYLSIAVFVMLGVLLMGPYVVRSINSNFKAADEGVMDAHREGIQQAPVQPGLNFPCNCTELTGCGTGADTATCANTNCGPRCSLMTRSCSPLGCETQMIQMHFFSSMTVCSNDATNNCCLTPTSTGKCGAQAVDVPGGCAVGKVEMVKQCGSPSPTLVYFCMDDSTNCTPSCAAKSHIPNWPDLATWCDLAAFDQNLLAPATAVQYVDQGHCLDTSDMRCKAECPAGSTAVPGGCNACGPWTAYLCVAGYGCTDGQKLWYSGCSLSGTYLYRGGWYNIQCVPDQSCNFACQGTPDEYSDPCPNTSTGLSGDTAWTYETSSQPSDFTALCDFAAASNIKCVTICSPGYQAQGGKCVHL